MAHETVVKETLTNEMKEAGAELIRRLDAAGFELNAGLWLYMEEPNAWRLMLASPIVTKDGPKKAYRKIQSVMSKNPEDRKVLSLANISAVEHDKPIVALLRKAGSRQRKPKASVSTPGVTSRAAATRTITPSTRESAGNRPCATSL